MKRFVRLYLCVLAVWIQVNPVVSGAHECRSTLAPNAKHVVTQSSRVDTVRQSTLICCAAAAVIGLLSAFASHAPFLFSWLSNSISQHAGEKQAAPDIADTAAESRFTVQKELALDAARTAEYARRLFADMERLLTSRSFSETELLKAIELNMRLFEGVNARAAVPLKYLFGLPIAGGVCASALITHLRGKHPAVQRVFLALIMAVTVSLEVSTVYAGNGLPPARQAAGVNPESYTQGKAVIHIKFSHAGTVSAAGVDSAAVSALASLNNKYPVMSVEGADGKAVIYDDLMRRALSEDVNAASMPREPLFGYYRIVLDAPAALVDTIITQIKKDFPDLKDVKPEYAFTAVASTGASQFDPRQWHLPAVKAPQAWEMTQGHPSIGVCVVDTGVKVNHPSLTPNLASGLNTTVPDSDPRAAFVEDLGTGHGTNVSGAAAAASYDQNLITGVAPQSTIVPMLALDAGGTGYDWWIAKAITQCVDFGNVRIISMSFGSTAQSQLLLDALKYAESKGILLVAAAGNYDIFSGYSTQYPAGWAGKELSSEIAATATDQSNVPAWWSVYIPRSASSVSAPGEGIWTVDPAGTAESVSGTSFSAPQVSGVMALMLSQNPDMNPAQVLNVITSTVTIPNGWNENYAKYGTGILNAQAAVAAVPEPAVRAQISSPQQNQPAHGPLTVRGRVGGREFIRYEIQLGEGREPQSWTIIHTSTAAAPQDQDLFVIDPASLKEGQTYTVRIAVYGGKGEKSVDEKQFHVSAKPPLLHIGTRSEAVMADASLLRGAENKLSFDLYLDSPEPLENVRFSLETASPASGVKIINSTFTVPLIQPRALFSSSEFGELSAFVEESAAAGSQVTLTLHVQTAFGTASYPVILKVVPYGLVEDMRVQGSGGGGGVLYVNDTIITTTYYSNDDSGVDALTRDGKIKWRAAFPDKYILSSLRVYEVSGKKVIMAISGDFIDKVQIHFLDLETGQELFAPALSFADPADSRSFYTAAADVDGDGGMELIYQQADGTLVLERLVVKADGMVERRPVSTFDTKGDVLSGNVIVMPPRQGVRYIYTVFEDRTNNRVFLVCLSHVSDAAGFTVHWKQDIGPVPQYIETRVDLTAVDMNKDGIAEIVSIYQDSFYGYRIVVYDEFGTKLREIKEAGIYMNKGFADVTGDGKPDMIIASRKSADIVGIIRVYNADGTIFYENRYQDVLPESVLAFKTGKNRPYSQILLALNGTVSGTVPVFSTKLFVVDPVTHEQYLLVDGMHGRINSLSGYAAGNGKMDLLRCITQQPYERGQALGSFVSQFPYPGTDEEVWLMEGADTAQSNVIGRYRDDRRPPVKLFLPLILDRASGLMDAVSAFVLVPAALIAAWGNLEKQKSLMSLVLDFFHRLLSGGYWIQPLHALLKEARSIVQHARRARGAARRADTVRNDGPARAVFISDHLEQVLMPHPVSGKLIPCFMLKRDWSVALNVMEQFQDGLQDKRFLARLTSAIGGLKSYRTWKSATPPSGRFTSAHMARRILDSREQFLAYLAAALPERYAADIPGGTIITIQGERLAELFASVGIPRFISRELAAQSNIVLRVTLKEVFDYMASQGAQAHAASA